MADFKKILIANRGEIAIRVMRAANELGKRTVAVYANEDRLSLHRFKADEAYLIGEDLGPVAAYLSIDEIIRVALACGADAIHPGYGLLSENPDFVEACAKNGITFIGPKAETMRALGDKASARKVAIKAGVPVIPATEVLGDDMDAIAAEAKKIGPEIRLAKPMRTRNRIAPPPRRVARDCPVAPDRLRDSPRNHRRRESTGTSPGVAPRGGPAKPPRRRLVPGRRPSHALFRNWRR